MKHDCIHVLHLRGADMLRLSFKCRSQGYFISTVQLNRQVTIQGIHSLFRSYNSGIH